MPELMMESIQLFHWQRPWWLLGIPLTLLAITLLWRRQSENSGWQSLIAPELLQHLVHGESLKLSRAPLIGLGALWIIASLALAGPSWEKIPQPIHKSDQALVVLMDLSPSMQAQDLKPSRLVRAHLKLIDFLKNRDEGLTALIAYAGEAHVITPLTDDTRTITALVPTLSPEIMPLSGSNPEMAVEQAIGLLNDAGISNGELLMITDGVDEAATDTIRKTLGSQHQLSILGVGTEAGAPIPISNGGFAKDKNGGMILARLNSVQLQQLSRSQGGVYRTLSATNKDIEALAQTPELLNDNTREVNREFDLWLDRGPWLALLLLPLLLLGFRRGWLLSILLVALPNPQPAMAFEWQDLWQTADQQGQALMDSGDPSAAAEKFENSQWAGSAHYQANEYEDAISDFATQDTATAHYNRGNALAKSGQLEEALKAYQQALDKQPGLEDASHNQQLIEELLKQKQEQQQDQQQDQSGDQSDSQNQEQQNSQSGQQDGSRQQQTSSDNNEQKPSDSNSDQQNSEPKDAEQKGKSGDESDFQDSDEQHNDSQPEETQSENAADKKEAGDPTPQPQNSGETELTPEQKESMQAMEQWLRKVPDDPSGLMREKFKYQYNQRRLQYQQGTWQPPENNALERW